MTTRSALPFFFLATLAAPTAWACHAPAPGTRIHISFVADSDLAELARWAKESACVDYAFASSLTSRRLAEPVILTVAAEDVGTAFEMLLHTMNLRSRGAGNHREIVAAGPETDASRAANLRERVGADRVKTLATIETQIQRKDDTHVTITRKGADAALANVDIIARSVRVTPELQGSRPIGFRIVELRPGSVLARLGLRSGDVVQSLNGKDLATPEQAIDAYAKLRSTNQLELRLLRNGKPVTLQVKID